MDAQLTNLAAVTESPEANSVTSWPSRTRSSVRYETIRSVPPYKRGGTLSASGEICAILIYHSQVAGISPTTTRRLWLPWESNIQLQMMIAAGEAQRQTHVMRHL